MRVRIDYMPPVSHAERRDVRTIVPEFELPKGWTLLDLKTALERREYRMVDADAEKRELEATKRAATAKAKAPLQEAGKS